MKRLDEPLVDFLHDQSWVIVSTLDKDGYPHNACKGIIKVEPTGKVYLLDIYKGVTHANLKRSPILSITAINEHNFTGYCLKGEAMMVKKEDLSSGIIKAWEDRITSRITQRVLRNLTDKKGHSRHPEALFPDPKYMIVMEVEEIVDLTPHHLK